MGKAENEKKKIYSDSVPTQTDLEIRKKDSIKIQKTKKHLSGFNSCQNRMGKAESE